MKEGQCRWGTPSACKQCAPGTGWAECDNHGRIFAAWRAATILVLDCSWLAFLQRVPGCNRSSQVYSSGKSALSVLNCAQQWMFYLIG